MLLENPLNVRTLNHFSFLRHTISDKWHYILIRIRSFSIVLIKYLRDARNWRKWTKFQRGAYLFNFTITNWMKNNVLSVHECSRKGISDIKLLLGDIPFKVSAQRESYTLNILSLLYNAKHNNLFNMVVVLLIHS